MNPIGWCDETWNPITGCTPISEACQNCYARRMANRLRGRYGYPSDEPFRVVGHPGRLDQPKRWLKPRRIFVVSMGDLFHEAVTEADIDLVFTIMLSHSCRHHTFMVLTKRPARMQDFVSACYPGLSECAPHIWLGVTAENQARADERIPLLLQTPAAVRFVSMEPMLGPVEMFHGRNPYAAQTPVGVDLHGATVDWIICGGETGPGARSVHPDWVRDLRDQCVAAEVPFWFKGWGGPHHAGWVIDGKMYQGKELDGHTWHERPLEGLR